jgi:hypothetical protein
LTDPNGVHRKVHPTTLKGQQTMKNILEDIFELICLGAFVTGILFLAVAMGG